MAARTKKTARKKVSRTTRRKTSVSRLDRLTRGLPPTLREFAKQVRTRLNRLEQRIDRVQASYRKQVAHLIRVTSRRIDQAEPAREQVIRLVSRLHRRQTSECYSSYYEGYLPTDLLRAIDALPSPTALAAIRRTGFITVLVHLEDATGAGRQLGERLQEAAERQAAPLRLVGRAAGIVAFEIIPTDD